MQKTQLCISCFYSDNLFTIHLKFKINDKNIFINMVYLDKTQNYLYLYTFKNDVYVFESKY